jgi:hypothetical protein
MSLTSTLSNVIIKNNTISTGAQTSNGSSIGSYVYTTSLSSNADCDIFGNIFAGLNETGNMLSLTGGSHKVSNNNFIRQSTIINSYINYTGSNDCMIVDNFFDSSTTDGTNELLVIGLTVNSTYERNKNQIAYTSTNVHPYAKPHNVVTGMTVLFDTTDGTGFLQGLENTSLTVTSPATVGAIFKMDLSTILPSNVQIMDVIYGFYVEAGPIDTSGSNSFYMDMVAGLTSSVSYTSPALSLADAHYQTTAGSDGVNYSSSLSATTLNISSGGDLTNFQANTQYLKINVAGSSVPQYYVTNKNIPIYLLIEYKVSVLNASTAVLTNSPLIIKYRW